MAKNFIFVSGGNEFTDKICAILKEITQNIKILIMEGDSIENIDT